MAAANPSAIGPAPQQAMLTIGIDPSVSEDERETLLLTLGDYADIRQAEQRDPLALILLFVAIMKDVGAVAGGATAVITLAEKILAWRNAARAHRVEPKVRFECPGIPPLDLATASDAAVKTWFS